MIKEDYIELIGHSRNKKFYTDKGYNIEVKKPCLVKVSDLSKGCMVRVTSICENCSSECKNIFKDYWNYTNGLKEPYYCNSCKVIKSEKTNIDRWGFKNPMQNSAIKDKLKDSIFAKYGVDWYSKTNEWLEKFKKTNIDRYGFDNPSKNQEIIEEIRFKNIEMLTSSEFRKNSKIKKQRNTWKKYAEMLPDGYLTIKYDTDIFTINHKVCGENFEITKGLLYNRLKNKSIICLNCNKIEIKRSSFELEVGSFLKSLSLKIEICNRKILKGLELDYYLPDYNLAIECNGLYWHSELFRTKRYHINKTNECRKLGINLIHIWEDDWLYKSDIIKSIIKNKIGIIDKRIYARNCLIREVSVNEYINFLDDNHIQGYSSSSYNIGLYHKDELVSLMTFGWRRTNNKREYELIRFCNKIDHLIIGSGSKLFRYFLKNNSIESIVSYSDVSIFNGGLYKKLGFKMIGLSDPNYFWVVDGIKRHRYNFSKRKLVKEGYDSNKTEVEIMNDRGYYRIFSTGQEKWVYRRV